MTSLAPPAGPRAAPRWPLLGALAAVAVLASAGIAAPGAALDGWLIGFAFAGGVPLGALALLLVHALTGGGWGEAHRPAFAAVAAATPLLLLFVLPLVFGARLIYPWAADPATTGPDVAAWYLNAPSLGLRSVAGLGILGTLAWRLSAGSGERRRIGSLGAGLGLCVYALFMNAAAYDWLLSLAPRFTSSAFGAQVIVGQLLSALCVVVLASDAAGDDPSWADLGALMLATTLGESYLVLMALAIDWYGDLPGQAAWYMSRTRGGWIWLEAAGTLLGAVLPMLALLFEAVRREPARLRVVALSVLAGLFIQAVWLVAPATEALSMLTGLLGALAIAGFLAVGGSAIAGWSRRRHVD